MSEGKARIQRMIAAKEREIARSKRQAKVVFPVMGAGLLAFAAWVLIKRPFDKKKGSNGKESGTTGRKRRARRRSVAAMGA